MNKFTNHINSKCSTPVFEQKNIPPNFPLSALRNENLSLAKSSEKVQKKSKQRRKCIEKESQFRNVIDSNRDSEYETCSESEIELNYSKNEQNPLKLYFDNPEKEKNSKIISAESYNTLDNQLQFQPSFIVDESSSFKSPSPLSPKLFTSPLEDDKYYKHYGKLYFYEDPPSPISISNEVDSSPVFQTKFKDSTQYKSYSRPGRKHKLSPSQISFFPNWVNHNSSKYNLRNHIPSKETSFCAKASTGEIDWTMKALNYRAEQLWCDFTKDNKTIPAEHKSAAKMRKISDKHRSELVFTVEKYRYTRFISTNKKPADAEQYELIDPPTKEKKRKRTVQMKPLREINQNRNTILITGNGIKGNNNSQTVNQLKKNYKASDDPNKRNFKMSSRNESNFVKLKQTSNKNILNSPLPKAESAPKKLKPKIISVTMVKKGDPAFIDKYINH